MHVFQRFRKNLYISEFLKYIFLQLPLLGHTIRIYAILRATYQRTQ